MIKIPTVTVHPTSIVLSQQIYTDEGNSYRTGRENIKFNRQINNHRLSKQSKRKLNRAITYMCELAPEKKIKGRRYKGTMKFKLSFVTLTLSSTQIHSDNEIKKDCLQPFLDYMRKMHSAKRFIWKAERQKNGNIHFHILFDVFIDYAVIRYHWNQAQERLGYISNYCSNTNVANTKVNINDCYKNINSTDVHSVRKIKDLHRYLCKYILKNHNSSRIRQKRNSWHLPKFYQKGLFTVSSGAKDFLKGAISSGRIWSCSYDLTNIKGGNDLCSSCYDAEVERLIASGKCYVKSENYFCYIGLDTGILKATKCDNLLKLLSDYLLIKFENPHTLI